MAETNRTDTRAAENISGSSSGIMAAAVAFRESIYGQEDFDNSQLGCTPPHFGDDIPRVVTDGSEIYGTEEMEEIEVIEETMTDLIYLIENVILKLGYLSVLLQTYNLEGKNDNSD